MSLVISDLHGNHLKLKTFLEYKPEEEHIVLGDFFDSFHASDNDIIDTFKLAMDNNVTVTVGNHDVVYLQNAHSYFRCSGNRTNHMFVHLMETYKDRFVMSLIRDNFLLSHGGLSKKHGKPFDTIEEANDWINSEWNWYKNQPVVPPTLSSIFDIGYVRGGGQEVSGTLWLTFGREKYDTRFNQVVGHTCSSDVRSMKHKKNILHVCVDTPRFICFNTATREFEDFMLDEYKSPDKEQMRKMIERQF